MRAPIVAVALLGSSCSARNAGAGASLDPVQAVLLPDGASAKNPLAHVGANGPWHIGTWCLTGVQS
jgi:acid phosphatase